MTGTSLHDDQPEQGRSDEETLACCIGMAILGSPPQLGQTWEEQVGNAVLNMPEMQAIKATLRYFLSSYRGGWEFDPASASAHLPPPVVAWLEAE